MSVCGYGRGVVFELFENFEQLAGRVGDRPRQAERAGVRGCARSGAGFRGVRCWFCAKKQIKDDLRSGQKPREKRQQKKRKTPIKSRLFRIFLLTNSAECDIIKMSREEGTPLLTEARRRKAVDVLTRSDLILILSMLADLIKAKAKNKIEAVQIILEQIDRLKK